MENAVQYIAYYRVSTQKQGASGLGLEAQRAAVAQFVHAPAAIVAEYTEIESGKQNHRPQLDAALTQARQTGATLIIAKLDRLSRNVGFIFSLRDSGVQFQCADLPEMSSLTIGLFAVIAQHERELISKRTKEALAVKKAQGFRLGNPNGFRAENRLLGVPALKAKAAANSASRKATAFILSLRAADKSWLTIAQTLNEAGFQAPRGGRFQAIQVQRLYYRAMGNQTTTTEN